MFWLFFVFGLTTALELKESEGNSATTEMISRLIEESGRSTLFFIDLNSEILVNFVKSHELSITVEVNDLETNPISYNRKVDAVILHLQNFGEFEHFFSLIRPEIFSYDGHFIILYDQANVQEIEKMFFKFWRAYIYNVNVLVTNPKSTDLVSMFTQMPFANGSCHNTKPVLINEFNITTIKWATNSFFPKKLKQLNRCPIRYGFYPFAGAFMIDNSQSGLRKFSGSIFEILLLFSDALNFNLNFVELEGQLGVVYENKTATGMLKKAVDNEVDFLFSILTRDKIDALSATRHVVLDRTILVVPPPFLIDPITKMFLPFTFASWISIGMVVLLACCIIKALKYAPTIVHDFVIGSNVKGSALNVCIIFLGGVQLTLPRSSYPRFLLTTLLIFTLIIRTLYQGQVFDLIKRDVRTTQLNTIDEYVDHKFTFHMSDSMAARLQGTKMVERHKVVSIPEAEKYLAMTLDSSFKGVSTQNLVYILYLNQINRKNFTFRICKEVLYSHWYVFYFTKNFYLVSEIDGIIGKCHNAGIFYKILKKYLKSEYYVPISEKNPTSAISYENIEGFFILFYYGSALALITFLCEIVYGYIQRNVG